MGSWAIMEIIGQSHIILLDSFCFRVDALAGPQVLNGPKGDRLGLAIFLGISRTFIKEFKNPTV